MNRDRNEKYNYQYYNEKWRILEKENGAFCSKGEKSAISGFDVCLPRSMPPGDSPPPEDGE